MDAVFTAAMQRSINETAAGLAQAAASLDQVDAFYMLVMGIFVFFMQATRTHPLHPNLDPNPLRGGSARAWSTPRPAPDSQCHSPPGGLHAPRGRQCARKEHHQHSS